MAKLQEKRLGVPRRASDWGVGESNTPLLLDDRWGGRPISWSVPRSKFTKIGELSFMPKFDAEWLFVAERGSSVRRIHFIS